MKLDMLWIYKQNLERKKAFFIQHFNATACKDKIECGILYGQSKKCIKGVL